MPEDNTQTPNPVANNAVPPIDVNQPMPSSAIVDPLSPDISTTDSAPQDTAKDIPTEVAHRIGEAHNVLIALSSDPSVDEMASAIGLSLFLDKLGKRATAIYSGSTPNALEFLKPEETFEPSADTLQDFVIALSKDKADHLRYKLDGDFVKIYITPYRTRISEEDLEFSYGDYNVDLVLALDVANGIDLDSALREHGRIMHDASIINITTSNPGRFGEIEWSDKTASSISEMIAKLLYNLNSKAQIEKEEATAFLTGIVAATDRFSNTKTTPATMQIASKLMESGANQQLISQNITPDVENELINVGSGRKASHKDSDPTNLSIEHDKSEKLEEASNVSEPTEPKEGSSPAIESVAQPEVNKAQPGAEINSPVSGPDTTEQPSASEIESSALLDDLKNAEASLSRAGAEAMPVENPTPIKIDNNASIPSDTLPPVVPPTIELPEQPSQLETPVEPAPTETSDDSGFRDNPEKNITPLSDFDAEISSSPNDENIGNNPEKVITPLSDFDAEISGNSNDESNKYGQMLEDALSSVQSPVAPLPETAPEASFGNNPAASVAPAVPSAPEINGVPEINYMPMPDEGILPPPPTPPIDMSTPVDATPLSASPSPVEPAVATVDNANIPTAPIAPAVPQPEPTPTSLGPQPAMQDQVYTPQAADPSAFKIPGM